jgi:hypothetical protein
MPARVLRRPFKGRCLALRWSDNRAAYQSELRIDFSDLSRTTGSRMMLHIGFGFGEQLLSQKRASNPQLAKRHASAPSRDYVLDRYASIGKARCTVKDLRIFGDG